MKVLLVCLWMIVVTAFVVSCIGQKPEIVKTAPPPLAATAAKADVSAQAIGRAADTAAKNIDEAAAKTSEVAGVVTTQAETLRAATPTAEPVAKVLIDQASALQNDVRPKLMVAREAVAEISKESKIVIQVVVPELRQADAAAQAISKERDAWQAKAMATEDTLRKTEAARDAALKKAKDASDNAIRVALRWVIVAGVIALAAGLFLAIKVSPLTGLSVAGAAVALIAIAACVSKWLAYLEWGAAILLAAVVGVVVWMLFTRNTAFFQTANLVEAIKQKLDPASLKAIFGDGAIPGLVHQIVDDAQSALYKLGVRTGVIKTATDPTAAAAVSPAGILPAGTPASAPTATPTPAGAAV